MENLHDRRKVYEKAELLESQMQQSPFEMFKIWLKDAENDVPVVEANAMDVSTVDPDGCPRTRIVLLKEYSEEGFVFYTNYNSKKGIAIEHNPKACLHFFWPSLERQVTVKAVLEKTSAENSDQYFHSRPRGSQIGAVVSPQSSIIPNRDFLEEKLAETERLFENKEVERPLHWGGYLAKPYEIEFWQGRPNRLHDRIVYRKTEDGSWILERLAP
ncbi:pyridoxamine 5'-phosphate oxidase [Elizabethkingia meningoseptica]|uniref:pyridoxamine 5'-phosphate oxidase n=1 Tax=Elizabethkingia meningoseptica TaxID=238 RepID=UPI0020129711|nr:pyridoxamine 5'-phosphate oxidase [Elizabethkingia meningoseptica]EJK5329277.1 pyridoxamine 5'-phosphate oxidase [Elizabethkingia meningoseptica]MCL1673960.1 pyridoxamine 5'-phosphate oxidase [Elizabethkingia meningoseptica]MCL1685399.1 pyridoxamine 5'-phosphate oxidase [Elizabethkingia meningoseptica]MDE5468835.1 pyridoxamine 5'-phosphate oxidase [Elizabethkingia meningoseptica]MDE5476148.1 pyridoxamine 5'-phosphate oxidase [Elizabethkingia meningoseptica]